jgi:ABC-type nitrate/sulfonate/bicarbonate transport system substrate-binding protein
MIRVVRLAVYACLIFGFMPSARADEAQPLRYGQAFSAQRSVFSLPIHIAMRQGMLSREGLTLRQFFIPGGGEKMIDALNDDTVDITHVATPFLIESGLKGSDVIAVAAEFNNPIYSLVARPEIRSIADLKGKLIGMADEAGPISMSIRRLLKRHGLNEGDFETRVISGTPSRLGCLTRGACDAVPLGQPQDVSAEREGFRIVGLSTDAVPPYLYTVTAVRRSWAGAHKDVVIRYVRALAAAFQFIRDPANRPTVIATIVEDTGCTEDDARRSLALYFEPERNVLPKRGEIDMAALAQAIAMMGESGQLKPPLPPADRFADLQYLHAAGVQ